MQKTIYFFPENTGEPPYFRLFFEYFILGNLLVTLKTMKSYNLQANFQKMEKSDLRLYVKLQI